MKAQISNVEWEVMRVVWDQAPIPASDIVAQLQTRYDWQPSTIRTLVGRLVKKRALRATRDGKRFLFSARLGQDECLQKESRSLAERVFGGEPVRSGTRRSDRSHCFGRLRFFAEPGLSLKQVGRPSLPEP
jgi:BlaI family penicillinase repressor